MGEPAQCSRNPASAEAGWQLCGARGAAEPRLGLLLLYAVENPAFPKSWLFGSGAIGPVLGPVASVGSEVRGDEPVEGLSSLLDLGLGHLFQIEQRIAGRPVHPNELVQLQVQRTGVSALR